MLYSLGLADHEVFEQALITSSQALGFSWAVPPHQTETGVEQGVQFHYIE